MFLFLWLGFRIMIGAGLIKIRAGQCWTDYTCMDYHYETQPNPNPNSWFLHNNPHWFHEFEVLINHIIELGTSWLLIIPIKKINYIGALSQIIFQFVIIYSGNLSFLNWLTIIPFIAAFDDQFILKYMYFLFHKYELNNSKERIKLFFNQTNSDIFHYFGIYSFKHLISFIITLVLALLIGYLSLPVVNNLLSKRQVMNTSFDNFRLVNTYGAFGTVGHERYEVIFYMTTNNTISSKTEWTEIIFKCKPGPINRRPCLITPYHYRLDWQIWFAGFKPHTPRQHTWIYLFIAQLLNGDINTYKLLDNSMLNYVKQNKKPKYIKADMYQYYFTNKWDNKNWWKREYISSYLPPLSLKRNDYQNILKQLGWWKVDETR